MSGEIVVIKFGGTSLASGRRLRRAAARVRWHISRGARPIVVVSAMGATTDRILLRLSALGGGARPEAAREVDRALATGEHRSAAFLAFALGRIGVAARSLTGPEAGVRLEGEYGAGTIRAIDPEPLLSLLDQGLTPVVCGYQGRRDDGEIATLTRGGSDTTAVAIAATFWSRCHIVTDVDAVYDRDPRLEPGAVPFRTISYDDLVALVHGGARVIHPDAAEIARAGRVSLVVQHYRSAFDAEPGTRIGVSETRAVAR